MTIDEILAEFERLGIRLEVTEDGRLRADPRGVAPSELREAVKEQRKKIIERLGVRNIDYSDYPDRNGSRVAEPKGRSSALFA